MMYIIALFVVPYLCFVVISDGLNPFFKPRNAAKRSRWRYGRAMALASLAGSVSIVAMIQTMENTSAQSFAIGLTVTLFMAIAFSTSRIVHIFWR